jgi:hypothetical protein
MPRETDRQDRSGPFGCGTISRLRDSQPAADRVDDDRVDDMRNRNHFGALWSAITESDGFESEKTIRTRLRAMASITSDHATERPDPFLRRCFFHSRQIPAAGTLARITEVHFRGICPVRVSAALIQFLEIRETPGPRMKPSPLEAPGRLKLLPAEDLGSDDLRRGARHVPFRPHGALHKSQQDVHLFGWPPFRGPAGQLLPTLKRIWPNPDDTPPGEAYCALQHNVWNGNLDVEPLHVRQGRDVPHATGIPLLSDEYGCRGSDRAAGDEAVAGRHERTGGDRHGSGEGDGLRRRRRAGRRGSGPRRGPGGRRLRRAPAHSCEDPVQRPSSAALTARRHPDTPDIRPAA